MVTVKRTTVERNARGRLARQDLAPPMQGPEQACMPGRLAGRACPHASPPALPAAHHQALLQVVGRQAQLLQLAADVVPAGVRGHGSRGASRRQFPSAGK